MSRSYRWYKFLLPGPWYYPSTTSLLHTRNQAHFGWAASTACGRASVPTSVKAIIRPSASFNQFVIVLLLIVRMINIGTQNIYITMAGIKVFINCRLHHPVYPGGRWRPIPKSGYSAYGNWCTGRTSFAIVWQCPPFPFLFPHQNQMPFISW